MQSQVLIVGAGPVGLAMAIELTRYGIAVRIIDKAPQRTDKSKALVIWSRTLELLGRAGCSSALVNAGSQVTSLRLTAGSEEIVHFMLDGLPTAYSYGLMLPQSETERLLDEHLNRLGVQVERSVELTQFTAAADRVTATLRHADGTEEGVETSWLIGCDGAHSTVRHQLGMQFAGDTLPSDWILADVYLEGLPWKPEIDIAWHSDGLVAIFPMQEGRYRIIADIGKAQDGIQRPDPTLEEVQVILDKRVPGRILATNAVWLSSFRINERKVDNYRSGRVFIAGDAAHVHSPAGGQGMNTGIQDACNLAWKLALVSRGICREEPLLDSYSIERGEVATQVLAITGDLTAVALITGNVKQYIRNRIVSFITGLSFVQKEAANFVTELSVGYSRTPLSVHDGRSQGSPVPGDRAPIRSDEPLTGAGDTPCFALFADSDQMPADLFTRYPTLLDPTLRKPFQPEGLWLVRPDGYTALATESGNWHAVTSYLDNISAAK